MDLKGVNWVYIDKSWVHNVKIDQVVLKGVNWVTIDKIRSNGLKWSQLDTQCKNQVIWS